MLLKPAIPFIMCEFHCFSHRPWVFCFMTLPSCFLTLPPLFPHVTLGFHPWILSLLCLDPVSWEEGRDNPFAHVCLSRVQIRGYMSPSVQPIPLGKDFPSGQWSKVLLVGSLHCVLDGAFANCEKAKPKKVLDFPSPSPKRTLSPERWFYHLCSLPRLSSRSSHIAPSRIPPLKKHVFGKSILQQCKGNPCIFLSFPSTSSSWKETETGIIKTSKSWCYKNNPAKCLM